MATDNASVLRACYEAFNTKELDRLASCAAPDAQATNVAFGWKGTLREDLENFARAFPDGRIEVLNLVAQGDLVCAEIVGRGTHKGPLAGPTGDIAPTGRRVEIPMAEIYRFRDGKIVELRYYFDAFSFYRQLGLGAPQMAEAHGDVTWPAAMH
jgi:predicted ester cyclase